MSLQPNEQLACDACGRFGAIDFGERKLCPDCYEACGSCCPEFGKEQNPDDPPFGRKNTEP